MTEINNKLVIENISDLNRTLGSLHKEIKGRPDVSGNPRIVFIDGNDKYSLLLQKSNLGYNISGSLNGATSYQVNTKIFDSNTTIGSVVLLIAGAPTTTTVEEFFS